MSTQPLLLELGMAPSGPGKDAAVRELVAVREIAHAFLNADRPEDVFRFALERVTPLVGASFASVYLVDGASELMRLAAAHNWPEQHRPWLGEMRVRLGSGPSGEAASSRRAIEVPDVFADPTLEDWQDVARELGFRALTAIPLQTSSGVLGALTFYFTDARPFNSETRGLLRLVADQMAATAEKATLIEALRRANSALVESNAELERQYAAVVEARRVKEEFLANISHELRTPLTAVMGYIQIMQEGLSGPLTAEQRQDLAQVSSASDRLLGLIDNLLELTTLKRGNLDVYVSEFDPRAPIEAAVAMQPACRNGVHVVVDTTDGHLPKVRSDRKKVEKILASLLSNACKFTERGEVRLSVALRGTHVAWTVRDTGIGIRPDALAVVFDEFRQADGSFTRRYGGSGLGLALARRMAQILGGDIDVASTEGAGSAFTVEIPLEYVGDLLDTVVGA